MTVAISVPTEGWMISLSTLAGGVVVSDSLSLSPPPRVTNEQCPRSLRLTVQVGGL